MDVLMICFSCSGFDRRSHSYTELWRSMHSYRGDLTCVVAVICKQDRGREGKREGHGVNTYTDRIGAQWRGEELHSPG